MLPKEVLIDFYFKVILPFLTKAFLNEGYILKY